MEFSILVHRKEKDRTVICSSEEFLWDALQRTYPDCVAVCGKRGRCGSCRIRVLQGRLEPSSEDRAYFTEEELEKGWRLSCRAKLSEDCEIDFPFEEEKIQVLTEGKGRAQQANRKEAPRTLSDQTAGRPSYGIAVDIGTTTLAAQLLELFPGNMEPEETAVSLNHQRAFGADVISRIQASNSGKKEELQETIRRDLFELIENLLKYREEAGERLKKICITGNTTMEHLLMGYSCETMGRQPFAPFNLERVTGRAEELLGESIKGLGLKPDLEVTLLPGISAFVGADISAGLLSCNFDQSDQVNFFLDLGTNGEMAIGNRERILVTSTAAGPAFEGGNIKWGRGSVPGAICRVAIEEDGKAAIQTINDAPPVGICGTGVIEIIAELLERDLMDETGRLVPEYAKEGYPLAQTREGETIVFTQKDIRELQLAKAAVRAGIQILLQKYGVKFENIGKFYLAGGFGYRIDQNKAAAVGILPKEMLDRIEPVGNSALAGAKLCLNEKGALERIEQIRKVSREVNLAREKDFQEQYADAMYFEEM